MKKIQLLLITMLLLIAGTDLLWLFFPESVNRSYTIILSIPAITICYFLHSNIKNLWYLSALTAFMMADYFFFVEKSFANGITCSGIALTLYGIIVLLQSHYLSTKRVLIGTIPFLVIYIVPFYFIIENISDAIFGEVTFYSFALGYFSFMSILIYFSNRNKITEKLLAAGIATALMGLFFGIYIFKEKLAIYAVIANMLFIFSHFKMWQYIVTKDSAVSEHNSFTQ